MFGRFRRDRSGSYAVVAALLTPALVGFAGLATEGGLWLYAHQTMVSAADAAAVSAATAGGNYFAEATGVIASYGFVNGVNGVTVTVNQPPKSGNHTTTTGAVEVIVQQQGARLFSALFSSDPVIIEARSVAVSNAPATGCVLALDRSAASAISVQGGAQVSLEGCSPFDNSDNISALSVGGSATVTAQSVAVVGGVSGSSNITTTNGIKTGVSPISDSYASVSPPAFSGCDRHNFSAKSKTTINPGVYCGGMTLNAGANVTLNPGVYFLDRGSLSVTGGATISGAGVTLVFTSSTGANWATAKIASNATVNLVAPTPAQAQTTGGIAGVAIFGDRNMPVGASFQFEGGATQTFGGAVYLPKADLKFAGGSSTGPGCIQLVADTIEFVGNSNLQIACSGYGTNPIGSATATLVE